VIVDLAVEAGGNCELSQPGKTITTPNGVKIVGLTNLPGRLAQTASDLYAKNLLNFLTPLTDKEKKGTLAIDWDDEIVKGCCVTRDGEVVNARVKDAMGAKAPAKKPAAKKTAAKKADDKPAETSDDKTQDAAQDKGN